MTRRSDATVDRALAGHLRAARQAAGLTMIAMADHLGVSYQQVQKYEAGTDRASAGTLLKWAAATGMDLPRLQADLMADDPRPPLTLTRAPSGFIQLALRATPEARRIALQVLKLGART